MTNGCLFVVVDGDNVSAVMIVFGSGFHSIFSEQEIADDCVDSNESIQSLHVF